MLPAADDQITPLALRLLVSNILRFCNASPFLLALRLYFCQKANLLQRVDAEEELSDKARNLLELIREHGQRYCQGVKLPVGGVSEECEREVEAEQEVEREIEMYQVPLLPQRNKCFPLLGEIRKISPMLVKCISCIHASLSSAV